MYPQQIENSNVHLARNTRVERESNFIKIQESLNDEVTKHSEKYGVLVTFAMWEDLFGVTG